VILVDSSVWIDYFNGRATGETNFLDAKLGIDPVLTGDLILAEVLQGFRHEKDFKIAKKLLGGLEMRVLCGRDIALRAAQNFRLLRSKGITPRKTIDTIIGTYCIAQSLTLLHSDRDFDVMEAELGLRVAKP
jgi:hypothetical protein